MRGGRVDRRALAVALLAHAALVDQVVVLRGLAGGRAERCPDLHGRDLAVGGALRPLAVFGLVLLGQPHVEHGAEGRITGAAAGSDDDALAGADVHGLGLLLVPLVDFDRGDAYHPPLQRVFPMNLGHLVLQQNLDAHRAGGLLQRPHEAGTAAGIGLLIRPAHDVEPRARAIEAVRRAPVGLPLDAVLLQPLEQVEIIVGIGADQLAVAEAADRLLRSRPVREHDIRRILHADRLLHPVAAADVEAAETHHRAPADVEILLDDQHRGALLARRDGGDEAAGAGANDDNIHLAVPIDRVRRLRRLRGQRGHGDRTRCARGQKAAPVDRGIGGIAGVIRRTGVIG